MLNIADCPSSLAMVQFLLPGAALRGRKQSWDESRAGIPFFCANVLQMCNSSIKPRQTATICKTPVIRAVGEALSGVPDL